MTDEAAAREPDALPAAEGVRVDEVGTVHVTDPRGLRAMAHPARQRALQALYRGREATATELAEECEATPASMSYHLRTLERWGLVTRGTSNDGRERPWRAAGKTLSVSPMTVSQADAGDAVAYLEAVMAPLNAHAARYARTLHDTTDAAGTTNTSGAADAAGAAGAGATAVGSGRPVHVSRGSAVLTTEELRELTDHIQAFLDAHQQPEAPAPDGQQRHQVDAYLAFLPHET